MSKNIEIIDFVTQGNPHLLVVFDGVTYRRFFTYKDLDLARHLANELIKWVVSETQAKT